MSKLDSYQLSFVRNMSRMTLNSNSEENSGNNSDSYLKMGPEPQDENYVLEMAKSTCLQNKRLFRLFEQQQKSQPKPVE